MFWCKNAIGVLTVIEFHKRQTPKDPPNECRLASSMGVELFSDNEINRNTEQINPCVLGGRLC